MPTTIATAFACAWGDSNSNGQPDLFVANDFGSSQLYRNNGDGHFTVVSAEAHVEGVGAGMSCCWCDFDNDGRQDIYVPSMWEAAGQRVSGQKQFHAQAPGEYSRALSAPRARQCALPQPRRRNLPERWPRGGSRDGPLVLVLRISWTSIMTVTPTSTSPTAIFPGSSANDLASFFWRQVVAKSSEDATPALAYERGWNAINELVRSDRTWHGYARNVLFANNRDGTFLKSPARSGLDFLEDSRSLRARGHRSRRPPGSHPEESQRAASAHPAQRDDGHRPARISFRLRGQKSNRDAIGAAITVEAGEITPDQIPAGRHRAFSHSTPRSFSSASARPRSIEHRCSLAERLGPGVRLSCPPITASKSSKGRRASSATPFRQAVALSALARNAQAAEKLPSSGGDVARRTSAGACIFSCPISLAQPRSLKDFQGAPCCCTFWVDRLSR